jgi:Flp pilus assembly protein TadG
MNRLLGTNTVTPMTLPQSECLKTLHIRDGNTRFKGQTTVELSLILLPFFAILFAIIDYAQIYFYENSLQNALRESTRFATAGRIIQATNADGSLAYETNNGVTVPKAISDTAGREASRNECIRYWFLSNCVIQMPLSNITITSAPTLPGEDPNIFIPGSRLAILEQTNGAAANLGPGGEGDYLQVTATNSVHTITPLFSYLGGYDRNGPNTYRIAVSAIVKNEPALLNFLHTNVYSDEVFDTNCYTQPYY